MLKMYLDLTPSSVQNSNGCIMMKLYRAANIAAGFSNKDAPPPSGWLAHPILSTLTCKNVDDCVPASQVNLRDIIPSIIVRGQEVRFLP